jgi:hypothetical protein
VTGRFNSEYVVDEEQIGRFRVEAGELLIPGWDPREDWSLGNFYCLRAGRWTKERTIPGGVHTYDMLRHQGALFAVLGSLNGGEVVRSTDDGKTWSGYPLPGAVRAYGLFTLNGRLYAAALGPGDKPTRVYRQDPAIDRPLFLWENNTFRRLSVDLFPDTPLTVRGMVVRIISHQGRLLYIGAEPTNDHQWTPFGLYMASSIDQAQRITLPPGELPYDLLVYDGHCYVLTVYNPWIGADFGGYLMRVWQVDELANWKGVLAFFASTFARSFEVLGGDLYFGLGCQSSQAPSETGSILRVRKEKFQ